MAGRPDATLAVLVFAFIVTVILYPVSSDIATLISVFAYIAIVSYAVYWAFSIRRALSVRLYRNQELALGFVAGSQFLDLTSHGVFVNLHYYLAYFVGEAIVSVILVYFIDASVVAGRMSDPRLRDTLHWRRLRMFIWLAVIAVLLAIISVATYSQISTGGVPFSLAVSLNSAGVLFDLVWGSLFVVAIPITAIRSKDPRLRAHLVWFTVFIALGFVLAPIGNGVVPVPATVQTFVILGSLIGEGYCLYRSARALVPLNRIAQT
jgi:hypothetical protein